MSVGGGKYWLNGRPVPAIGQDLSTGATRYWLNGAPVPFLASAEAGSTEGYVTVWSGSAWVRKPAKVWTGSAWVQKPVKVWNGSAWLLA